MNSKIGVTQQQQQQPLHHKFEIGQAGRAIPHSVPVRFRHKAQSHSNYNHRTFFNNMTMKHPREDERVETSIALLGSDHSKRKRQRTMSAGSESSTTENRSFHSNTPSNSRKKITSSTMGGTESNALSPRMMALLSSLEALEDTSSQQRQIKQQWPLGSTKASTQTPPAIPHPSSSSTNQVASSLLQQKHHHPKMGQPLTARPAIHKIEEHPPVQGSTSTSTTTAPQLETRDAFNHSPSVDTAAINTIKRAVAAATATVGTTFENNPSTYTAVNAALAQHRITGAAPLTAVASKNSAAYVHAPLIGSQSLQLASFSFPTISGTNKPNASSAKYGISHLNHTNVMPGTHRPSARQLAIHKAVHNDYKKIYKPLKRPPRLPTPHEALVIAAISTAAPTASICR